MLGHTDRMPLLDPFFCVLDFYPLALHHDIVYGAYHLIGKFGGDFNKGKLVKNVYLPDLMKRYSCF